LLYSRLLRGLWENKGFQKAPYNGFPLIFKKAPLVAQISSPITFPLIFKKAPLVAQISSPIHSPLFSKKPP
jgi:hypothetical protein